MAESRDAFPAANRGNAIPTAKSSVLDDDGFRVDAHAVVVGINDYQDPRIPPLRYARADAQAMYDVLTDPTVGRFKPENVALLLDEQASYKRIKSEIGTRLPKRTDENSTVCVYFAGHGAPHLDALTTSRDRMEKYLIPYDADADDLRATGLSMQAVQDYFGYITSRQLIFFLDCCYSGGANGARSFDVPGVKTRATLTDEFLDSLANDACFVVTACGIDEVSLEAPEKEHGLFTYFLVKGLKGDADSNGDGLVTMDELYAFVYKNVERESVKLGNRMRPMRRGSASGDVYLTQYETANQRRARVADSQAVVAFEAGDLETARRLWTECLQAVPSHERATARLTLITERIQAASRQAERLAATRQSTLLGHRRSGVLKLEEYAEALELLDADPSNTSDDAKELTAYVQALADGRITPSQYLKSVKSLRANAVPSHQQTPVAKQMAAAPRAARANTGSVETARPSDSLKISMKPPSPSIGERLPQPPLDRPEAPAFTATASTAAVEVPSSKTAPQKTENAAKVSTQPPNKQITKPSGKAPPIPNSPRPVNFADLAASMRDQHENSARESASVLEAVSVDQPKDGKPSAESQARNKLSVTGKRSAPVRSKRGVSGTSAFAIGLVLGFGVGFLARNGAPYAVATIGLSLSGAVGVGSSSTDERVAGVSALLGLGWSIGAIGATALQSHNVGGWEIVIALAVPPIAAFLGAFAHEYKKAR